MALKPQDLLVTLKLASVAQPDVPFARLADELGLSLSEVHAATKRAQAAGLIGAGDRRANPTALLEFLEHGVRYAFAPKRTGITRGMPTAHCASPMREMLMNADDEGFVWPDPEGDARGQGLEPLFKTVPAAARRDRSLYEMLVLTDSLRVGGARERKVAMELLRPLLLGQPKVAHAKNRRG